MNRDRIINFAMIVVGVVVGNLLLELLKDIF